jgi:hypothetical protein
LANCGGGEVTNQINELFAKALGIAEPWFVKEVDFDAERHEMTIRVDFVRGTKLKINQYRDLLSSRHSKWRPCGGLAGNLSCRTLFVGSVFQGKARSVW